MKAIPAEMSTPLRFASTFWCRWTIASGIGAVVGLITAQLLWSYLSLLVLPVSGGLFGVAQWVVLRRYAPRIGVWALATAGGALLAGFIPLSAWVLAALFDSWWSTNSSTLIGTVSGWAFGIIVIGLPGAIIGLLQQPALAPHSRHARWWIAASALAGAAFVVCLLSLQMYGPIISGLAGGLAYGSVSGIALLTLLLMPARN
jgi:hypothetical protein